MIWYVCSAASFTAKPTCRLSPNCPFWMHTLSTLNKVHGAGHLINKLRQIFIQLASLCKWGKQESTHAGLAHAEYTGAVPTGCRLHRKLTSPELAKLNWTVGATRTVDANGKMMVSGPTRPAVKTVIASLPFAPPTRRALKRNSFDGRLLIFCNHVSISERGSLE